MKPENRNVAWWEFWNPRSGAIGGLLMAALLGVLAAVLIWKGGACLGQLLGVLD